MTTTSAMTALLGATAPRLLVIDDDRVQRLLIGQIGQREGFTVDLVESVDEAVAALHDREYTTVAIDLSLGESDGLEIIEHIATLRQHPAVIVISGFDARIRDAAIRFGASLGLSMVGELRKPIDIAQLRSLLGRRATGPAPDQASPLMGEAITAPILADAIARGEVAPVYQPKVDLETGRIVGCEALARWTSRDFGPVPAPVFVDLAERYGLASDLTRTILRRALGDAARWHAHGAAAGVAVNVPPSALVAPGFPEMVEEELAVAGCPASVLTLEVTETTAMSDIALTGGVLTRLRIRGVQLSLDDFGTGYSSLTSLLRMPFGELKIDRSFVQACDRDSYAWKIVRATLSLAREFGMKTVAEGIETAAVASMLRIARCDIGQGYHFARPMPAAAFEARLLNELAES
jgi:EAL domain-containing protein (putative c-di-GMP-specific phosphodiesterase class I)/ActR/RegA family two-component response regulator